MSAVRIVLRVFGTMFFVLLIAGDVGAQVSECDVWDDDRNGSIEIADLAPLLSQYRSLSDCLTTDFSAARRCEMFDANGDSYVNLGDFRAVLAIDALYVQCAGSLVHERPECAAVDADGDGRVDALDFGLFRNPVDVYRSCLATDLSVLRCEPVDYDGDAYVSIGDGGVLYGRFEAFRGCLGTRLGRGEGLWITHARLMTLPTRGPAWQNVLAEATAPYLTPDLRNQDDPANTRTLAKALVGIRLAREDLIDEVRRALRAVTYDASERGASALAVGRELVAYVIAADIIDLALRDPSLDADFRAKLGFLREANLQGRTLVSTHAERPNNWGTHAGATRVAIALYLQDDEDLAAAAEVHRAWFGEPTARADFRFGELAWQADEGHPVGINPRGARRNGIDVGGALPEEMRRGGPLANPPARTGYAWEALQGATVAAELLATHGYPDAWRWGDDALLRAVDYLYRLHVAYGGWWASGDDRWNVWLVNHGTGSFYPTQPGVSAGKNVGFTDWTHAE